MSILVVGGDYLGCIEKNLQSLGVTEMIHISGRRPVDKNKISMPKKTAFILILTDYVNHCTANTVKTMAKARSIPLVFAKRSWCDVEEKLKTSSLI